MYRRQQHNQIITSIKETKDDENEKEKVKEEENESESTEEK